MNGAERREDMINRIKGSKKPVSGSSLAKSYHVSRQVIVQDIALIRASGYDIISTNRGYILNGERAACRVFKVRHTDAELQDELCEIVDMGGRIVNVIVNHHVYGHLEAALNINSRRKVMEFMEEIRSGKSSPLKNITSGYHYHKVEADNEETLDMIEEMLRKRKYLIERM